MTKKYNQIFFQILSFAGVGVINTAVDLIVLNALMYSTGITTGWYYSIFKSISFVVAVTNSYYMNKYWTFKDKDKSSGKEFSQFFVVSVIGFVINVGVASLVIQLIPNFIGVSGQLWGNVGALAGTFVGLAWNFIGYKLLVFKK